MVIYPVPVEVTQARIQLLVDQNAKAPPNTINQDLQAVYHAKAAPWKRRLKSLTLKTRPWWTSRSDAAAPTPDVLSTAEIDATRAYLGIASAR